ncbi:MAG: DpnD/PcfM family protein [Clostridia bacterium]
MNNERNQPMEAYSIRITETMEREIVVEARSKVEALATAMKKYQDRKYVLFPGRHISTDFDIMEADEMEENDIAV